MFFDAMRGHTRDPHGGKLCEGPLRLPHDESRTARLAYTSKIWKTPDGRPDRHLPPVSKTFEDVMSAIDIRALAGSALDDAEKDGVIRKQRQQRSDEAKMS